MSFQLTIFVIIGTCLASAHTPPQAAIIRSPGSRVPSLTTSYRRTHTLSTQEISSQPTFVADDRADSRFSADRCKRSRSGYPILPLCRTRAQYWSHAQGQKIRHGGISGLSHQLFQPRRWQGARIHAPRGRIRYRDPIHGRSPDHPFLGQPNSI